MSQQSTVLEENVNTAKFDLDMWLIENWEGYVSYGPLTQALLTFDKQHQGGKKRSARIILKEDFGLEKKAVNEYSHSLKSTKSQKKSDEQDLQENSDAGIATYLQDSIGKRIPAKTYQSGFSAPQLGYIFKLAKDHFEISWSELFSPFDVTGTTIQEKAVSALDSLGFVVEKVNGEDEIIRYKISYTTEDARNRIITDEKPSTTKETSVSKTKVSFPLQSWLVSHWEGKASYPTLREAITEFERQNENPRKFRDVVKQDFDIPKSWNIKQIVKRMNELKLDANT